ncbi:MAG: hypothetical protein IPK53_01835 [bacterium]|nr:hypothetical protein [bacterium]MBK8127705.1 hypothetical protein [bacterium]
MRRFLLILGLVVASAAFAQPTITNAEYYIGADPGPGLATAITVAAPSAAVPLAWTIPTGSLTPNLYRVFVRVRTNLGLWGPVTNSYLIVSAASQVPLLVTQFEWSVDDGSYTIVDVTDASTVNLNQLLSTVALAPGVLHRVNLRVTDNTGRTGPTTLAYLAISAPNHVTRLVTQFEYAVDGDAFTPVDIADVNPANLAQVISTVSLTPGILHSVKFRITDDLGRVSVITNQYLPIAGPTFVTRSVASFEYWVDSNPPTVVDNVDAPIINISELIASNSIPVGLHLLNIRPTDNTGRVGPVHNGAFIVMSPFQNSLPRTIVAAEVFVGNDPGIGNGVNVPLPTDGTWDEGNEPFAQVFTGFDVGYYRIGYRTQDNLGRWSGVAYDSLLVGPLLTVISSGNDVILNWEFPDGIDEYYIQRAANTAGPFTTIDSTTARTYTDTGIITTQAQGYYTVTFRDDSISVQSPPGTPARQ